MGLHAGVGVRQRRGQETADAINHHRTLGAVVAIFEKHYVIQFGSACLQDDCVLKGSHAVPSSRAEMDCFARKQLEGFQWCIGPTHFKEKPA